MSPTRAVVAPRAGVFNRVPPEMLVAVARHMSYDDLCKTIRISKRWRATLLAAPFLWDRIDICLLQRNVREWIPMIKAFLARGQAYPLTIQVDWMYDLEPATHAVATVFSLLSANMGRIKSLALSVPVMKGMSEFRHPAPILEVFRFHTRTDVEVPYIPKTLFSGSAPRLRELDLYLAGLPRPIHTCPAFSNVTHFLLHWEEIDDYALFSAEIHLPSVTSMTVTTSSFGYSVDPTMVQFPTVTSLRLIHAKGIKRMLRCFPNASSVAYSCATLKSHDTSGSQTILRALGGVRRPASVEIRWTRSQHVDLPWVSAVNVPSLAVALNGVDLLVDVSAEQLRSALTHEHVQALVARAHTICVPEELWDLFARCKIPQGPLAMTLLLRPRDDWAGDSPLRTAFAPHDVRSLTIARPVGCFTTDRSVLPARLLVQFLKANVVEGALQKLVLRGFALDEPGNLEDVEVPIEYDALEADSLEPWTWDVVA